MIKILIWLLGQLLNWIFAWENFLVWKYRHKTGNPKQIEHTIYGAVYAAICAAMFLKYPIQDWHSWLLYLSLLLQHISTFPVIYNRYRDNPWFFLSTTTSAKTDQLMVKLGLKDTAVVNILAFIISIILACK